MDYLWLNETTGELARCEQLDADGHPKADQIRMAKDDPRVEAYMISEVEL